MTRTDRTPDKPHSSDSTLRHIQREGVGNERMLKVFCPRIGEAIDVRECRSCDYSRGLCIDPSNGETVLRCAWQGTSAFDRTQVELEEVGPIEVEAEHRAARHTPLAAIMTSPARSVTPETSITTLVRLFLEEGISAAPVVDSAGKAIGIVSKTDVVRRCFEDETAHAPRARTAADGSTLESGPEIVSEEIAGASAHDVMTHIVYTLAAEASISRAAALMAYEGVHRIVVAAADGTALGIVSALDILRWMARQDGYIVPELTRIQTDQRSKRPE